MRISVATLEPPPKITFHDELLCNNDISASKFDRLLYSK